MKFNANGVEKVIAALLNSGARRATKYLQPGVVISACRPCYDGKLGSKRDTRATIVVKLGRPNYEERKFIRACLKAGEPFPVKKIQLKSPPQLVEEQKGRELIGWDR